MDADLLLMLVKIIYTLRKPNAFHSVYNESSFFLLIWNEFWVITNEKCEKEIEIRISAIVGSAQSVYQWWISYIQFVFILFASSVDVVVTFIPLCIMHTQNTSILVQMHTFRSAIKHGSGIWIQKVEEKK